MPPRDIDQRVRLAAFRFLEEQTNLHGEVLLRALLANGFTFEGERIPLISPQGIFKPAILAEIPLTITTVPIVEAPLQQDPIQVDVGVAPVATALTTEINSITS